MVDSMTSLNISCCISTGNLCCMPSAWRTTVKKRTYACNKMLIVDLVITPPHYEKRGTLERCTQFQRELLCIQRHPNTRGQAKYQASSPSEYDKQLTLPKTTQSSFISHAALHSFTRTRYTEQHSQILEENMHVENNFSQPAQSSSAAKRN